MRTVPRGGSALADIATDAELMTQAVGTLAKRTRLPVAFGGFERSAAVDVTSVVGARTALLRGLVVAASRGLGGRVLVERRPRLALDYETSAHITHDYDRVILGEGISTLLAVPVLVGGRTRGVLYCGARAGHSFGDRVTEQAVHVATDLATELRVRDELRKRLPAIGEPERGAPGEVLREAFAELRAIAAATTDEQTRIRLHGLERRLITPIPAQDAGLTARELDVIAGAALGGTNAEIASSLSLKPATVKSYLQSAMAKLGASTRHAAVSQARRRGLLP